VRGIEGIGPGDDQRAERAEDREAPAGLLWGSRASRGDGHGACRGGLRRHGHPPPDGVDPLEVECVGAGVGAGAGVVGGGASVRVGTGAADGAGAGIGVLPGVAAAA